MIVNHPKLKCTGVPKPREWDMNGQKGISYKVELSDGSGNISLPCADGDIWSCFEPFKDYSVEIEITQVARENILATRCRVINAAKV